MANWKCIFISALYMIFVTETWSLSTVYLDDHCGNTVNIFYSTRIKASRSSTLQRNLNCVVYAQAVVNEQVVAVIKSYDTLSGTGGICSSNRLDIYDGHTTDPQQRLSGNNGICGYLLTKTEYFTNSSQFMTFQFTTGSSYQTGRFEIILTSFHKGPCRSGEFKCLNNRCIDDNLVCDGYNHCGDNSGQLSCVVGLAVGVIAAIVIAAIVVVVCLPIFVIVFICKRLSYQRF